MNVQYLILSPPFFFPGISMPRPKVFHRGGSGGGFFFMEMEERSRARLPELNTNAEDNGGREDGQEGGGGTRENLRVTRRRGRRVLPRRFHDLAL